MHRCYLFVMCTCLHWQFPYSQASISLEPIMRNSKIEKSPVKEKFKTTFKARRLKQLIITKDRIVWEAMISNITWRRKSLKKIFTRTFQPSIFCKDSLYFWPSQNILVISIQGNINEISIFLDVTKNKISSQDGSHILCHTLNLEILCKFKCMPSGS